MKKISAFIFAAVTGVSAGATLHAQAANNFGQAWHSMSASAADQVRVVYYRPVEAMGSQPAHIYVDGEFQTALLAGGYTVFCLAPGVHSLGSFVNDAPAYAGKQKQPWRDSLAAGKTYYIRASLDNSGRPLVIPAEQAQQELAGTRQQTHLKSRASAVTACKAGTMQSYDNYAFSSDLLFRFGSASSADISREGREAIAQLASSLKTPSAAQRRIVVTGFTDPIGTEESNMRLGQLRADAIKQLLINYGISAELITAQSMGASQVNKQCDGPRKKQISCYASERRVIISVEK